LVSSFSAMPTAESQASHGLTSFVIEVSSNCHIFLFEWYPLSFF
jgi:hypothetical protein